MDEAGFWDLIDRAHSASEGDMDRKCDVLTGQLAALSRDEVLRFVELFDAMMIRAYNWSLWGAAYVIHGGCGDDTFQDFCSALISRGREQFESALADPDGLADRDIDEESWFYEGFQYAVTEAAIAVAGERPSRLAASRPSGTEFSEEAVYALYPRLAAKFGS